MESVNCCLKVAGVKVYWRETWNFRSNAASARIDLDITGQCMHLTGLCMHVLHALPHDVTGQCMQLLHGLCCVDFVLDIPLPLATLSWIKEKKLSIYLDDNEKC
jgi:hypothetical protein